MNYKGYLITPVVGERVVPGKAVRVFRGHNFLTVLDSADAARANIDRVLEKYKGNGYEAAGQCDSDK